MSGLAYGPREKENGLVSPTVEDVGDSKEREAEVHTVVASDKSVAVRSRHGPVDRLLCLFERDVHVSVHRLELTWKAVVFAGNKRRRMRLVWEVFEGKIWYRRRNTVERRQLLTSVHDARVELDGDGRADDAAEEVGRVPVG